MIIDIKKRLDGLLHLLEQMAGGDLKIRLPITPNRDEVDALAFGVNLLADEVQFKQKLEENRRADLEEAQKKLEATLGELRTTQDQLVQSAKLAALGELAAGLAHEINNPLTVIQGYFEKIELTLTEQSKMNPQTTRDALDKISRNIARIVELIKTVKDFSRQRQVQFEKVNLVALMDASLNLLEQPLYLRGIAVHRKYESSQIFVKGDSVRLEQVFINILSNAIDAIEATGNGAGNMEIVVMKDGEFVKVEVKDDGVGIDPEVKEHVFDPFFTTKEVGRGTGLGLSISHRIVKDHHGIIDLNPGEVSGATVKICFPLPRGI